MSGIRRHLLPCFNPHPARRPDATGGNWARTSCRCTSFNPHPARRPDATIYLCQHALSMGSFNPHPARRPDATCASPQIGQDFNLFQSSSGPKTGCYYTLNSLAITGNCFNPHPARRPDATGQFHSGARGGTARVSILIRPEDRMLPCPLR